MDNTELLGDMIEEHDTDLLKYCLEDIQVQPIDVKHTEEKYFDMTNIVKAFKVSFHFKENEYFFNKVLSKRLVSIEN